MATNLADQAVRWIKSDPDPATRAELESLLAADNTDELADRFSGALEFGTAGIRGVVGAGESRMNRAVIIRTTKGLADWLAAQGRAGPVILGQDARLSSRDFAGDTAAVLGAAGLSVLYFPQPVPTPLVAYACRVLEAAAGIVITASHNPPEYNGYKVYDRNAAQIVPPVDAEIAAAIAAAPPAADVERIEDPFGDLDDKVLPAPGWIFESYLEEVLEIRPPIERDISLRIVHTPLHGVGGTAIREALTEAGYQAVSQVAEQTEPDGHFPTVAFPNPEEEGALDLAQALARETGADLIIANDPDVDRLAVGLPADGEYRLLTGNQIGVLLGDYLLEHSRAARPLVISSIVSSPMLGEIAAAHGADFTQTLTGFKWICNAALDLANEGLEFVFGYEEALGYSVGRVVRDKDGIGAAVHFCDLAASELAQGRTVWDRLGDLYARHGLWVSSPKNFVRPGADGLAEIAAAMERLEHATPSEAGGRKVQAAMDYRRDADARPRWLPAAALVELRFADGRALIRPSGTEPKLKIYVDLRADLDGDDWRKCQADLAMDAAAVGSDIGEFLGFD